MNPLLTIEATSYVMVTQFIITIEARVLRDPVDNLDRQYDAIKSAYDMAFNGF